MGIKEHKPVTAGRRGMTSLTNEEITKGGKRKIEKRLVKTLNSNSGRNNQGKITVRHRGGGCKSQYRIIDFKRKDKDGVIAKVNSIQYDPNRSANIALLYYVDGDKRYILAPLGIKEGDIIEAGEGADIKPGNVMRIKDIPDGTIIHNIELKPGKGGQIVRSAGGFAQLMAKDGDHAQVRLPSGEVRLIRLECRATIGQVGNVDYSKVNLGKAGRKRWMGIRPTVRGSAMNPCDHPHGGGEGKAPIGRPAPVTPWGKPALGKRTRKKKKYSDSNIVSKRQKKSGRK